MRTRRPMLTPPRRYLKVRDSGDYTEVEHALRQEWRVKHPGAPTNRGGRPSVKNQVFDVCEVVWRDISMSHLSMYKMIRAVERRLRQQNHRSYANATVYKHVRRWMLETRSMNEINPRWLRLMPWVIDFALACDFYGHDPAKIRSLLKQRRPVECVFYGAGGHPDIRLTVRPFPEDPRVFARDAQAFFKKPTRVLEALDNLIPPPPARPLKPRSKKIYL